MSGAGYGHGRYGSRGTRTASKLGGVRPIDGKKLDALLAGNNHPKQEDADMTVMEKIAARLRGAKDSVRALRDADQELRGAYAQAEAERQLLLTGKAPKADVIATMEAAVDAIATEARGNLGPRLVEALSGGVDLEPTGKISGLRPGSLAPAFFPQPLVFQDLAALCPDVLKVSLRAAVLAFTYREGPAMGTRLRLLEECDARKADIAEQHARLVDEAAEAGITLEHLPDERARRAYAAHQARPRRPAVT